MTDDSMRAVFARLGSRTVPRVARMMQVARDMGYEVVFCGAFRGDDLPSTDTWEGWNIVRLGKPYPLLNGRHPLLYLKSVFFYNRELLRYLRESHATLVHASDFEAMPASILYRLLRRRRLVYNIHDNLAQRYNLAWPLRFLLNQLEGIFVLCANHTVVPEVFRRSSLPFWCRYKVSVVRNTPADPGFTDPLVGERRPVRLFFGGWLDWGRGLAALIRLAERNEDIELRVAGEGAPDIVAALGENPAVTYLGFLANDEAIDEMRKCDFIPALYDPARVINRYAASNKLAEALAVGRPVIINSEMKISETMDEGPHLIVTEYAGAGDIAATLRQRRGDEEAYLASCRMARQTYLERFNWSVERPRAVAALGGDRNG